MKTLTITMLEDKAVMEAVSAILQRSERQPDTAKLISTFVDVGIVSQLQNRNNQIVFGRRGTGKTHIFRILENILAKDTANAVLYIDARTLGSTSQFSDSGISLQYRCTALFRDVLSEIHNCLREHLVSLPESRGHASLEALAQFSNVATQPVVSRTDERVGSTEKMQRGGEALISGSLSSRQGLGIEARIAESDSVSSEMTRSYGLSKNDKVVFPEVRTLLTEILKGANATLFLLVDEWSSLPVDIQPFLAEFLKRALLPNPHIILKIAALDFRSAFCCQKDDRFIGFELGADVAAALDIDDYYVYDRNPTGVSKAFEDMLYLHIISELSPNYLQLHYQISTAIGFRTQLFASKKAFDDLVRASEGVARDLINVFSTAYFDCNRRHCRTIYLKAVEQAARQWYEQDKVQNLDDHLRLLLTMIVDDVIGKRNARSFLLPREFENHPAIQKLFDARVLHLMCRGYADKDRPGTRYNIYTLDYGTYVDLRLTTKSQERDLFSGPVPTSQSELDLTSKNEERIVPFDDRRSIRRIILKRDILDKWQAAQTPAPYGSPSVRHNVPPG